MFQAQRPQITFRHPWGYHTSQFGHLLNAFGQPIWVLSLRPLSLLNGRSHLATLGPPRATQVAHLTYPSGPWIAHLGPLKSTVRNSSTSSPDWVCLESWHNKSSVQSSSSSSLIPSIAFRSNASFAASASGTSAWAKTLRAPLPQG